MLGYFDLKWLLRENGKKFFKKLQESRLCKFLEAFREPEIREYGKYFR